MGLKDFGSFYLHNSSIFFILLLLLSTTVSSQITNPRPWAEWEETNGVILHQPNFHVENPTQLENQIAEEWDRLYLELITGLLEEGVNIYYILDSNDRPEYHSSIIDTMHLKYGVDTANALFHVVYGCRSDYNRLSKWTRDNGPMNVYKNEVDSLYFFLFSDDNRGAGGVVRDFLNVPDTVFYQSPAGSSGSDGGNYMTDGNKMAIINGSSDAILPDIQGFYGLDTVHCLTDYLYHIDYYLKMVDEETLLAVRHSPDDYTYGSEPYTYEEDSVLLMNMLAYIQESIISQYGRPMKVYTLPAPPSINSDSLQLYYYTQYASYTNSLIVNNSVFVPQYDIPDKDNIALDVYRSAMPGYKIVPVYSRRAANEGGAVHCLTNSVATPEPILIRHAWYNDTLIQQSEYQIEANIKTRNGVADARVYYSKHENGPFEILTMVGTGNNNYRCGIPHEVGMTELYYYIKATSNSGIFTTKPFVAPDHSYKINIQEDNHGVVARVSADYGQLKVFPNPASEFVNIAFSSSSFDNEYHQLTFLIYDLYGKTCLKRKSSTEESQVSLDIRHLSAGTYFIILHDEWGRFMSEKLVVY